MKAVNRSKTHRIAVCWPLFLGQFLPGHVVKFLFHSKDGSLIYYIFPCHKLHVHLKSLEQEQSSKLRL